MIYDYEKRWKCDKNRKSHIILCYHIVYLPLNKYASQISFVYLIHPCVHRRQKPSTNSTCLMIEASARRRGRILPTLSNKNKTNFTFTEIWGRKRKRHRAQLMYEQVWLATRFPTLTRKGSGNKAGSSKRARERSTQMKKYVAPCIVQWL